MGKIEARTHGEVAGYFTLSTNKRGVIAEFPNLITNGGLDRMGGFDDWLTWCQVGSGSTAPNVNDTALVSRVAGTSSVVSPLSGVQSTPPYYTWNRKTFRFSEGAAAGNLSEVGIGWASSASLLSRALILDTLGNPTTITVLADESLDVTYEFRFYPKTTDDTGTVTLTGNIGGVYNWTMRAANVTSNDNGFGWNIAQNGTNMGRIRSGTALLGGGDIVAITGLPPAGSSVGITAASYVPGSYERKFTFTAGLTQANIAGGVRCGLFPMGIGMFQIQFGLQADDSKIPKTSDGILSMVIKHSWGRRP